MEELDRQIQEKYKLIQKYRTDIEEIRKKLDPICDEVSLLEKQKDHISKLNSINATKDDILNGKKAAIVFIDDNDKDFNKMIEDLQNKKLLIDVSHLNLIEFRCKYIEIYNINHVKDITGLRDDDCKDPITIINDSIKDYILYWADQHFHDDFQDDPEYVLEFDFLEQIPELDYDMLYDKIDWGDPGSYPEIVIDYKYNPKIFVTPNLV